MRKIMFERHIDKKYCVFLKAEVHVYVCVNLLLSVFYDRDMAVECLNLSLLT